MSLYPQNGYGQMSYGGPSYAHTGGYYQPPPPPPNPYHHVDPHSFRRDYSARLAELTINSRPIIQNLSMIAQEFTRYSDIVVQCIEAHIKRVSFISSVQGFLTLADKDVVILSSRNDLRFRTKSC